MEVVPVLGGAEVGAANVAVRALGFLASTSRRPRIRAHWLKDDPNPYIPPIEGLAVEVICGRRPIELHEAGVKVWHGPRHRFRRRRSRVLELHAASPDKPLPVRLEDGDMLHFGWHLDDLIDELHKRIGDDRITAQLRVFVRGSGAEYRARIR
jgi:hypothetical protein